MNESKEPEIIFVAPSNADADSPDWRRRLHERIVRRDGEMLSEAQAALQAHPSDPEVSLMAALAALFAERPDLSLRYEHRFAKRFVQLAAEGHLLRALALAQQERWAQATQIVKQHGYGEPHSSFIYLPGDWALRTWVHSWLNKIVRADERRSQQPAPKKAKTAPKAAVKGSRADKGAKGQRRFAAGKEAAVADSSPDAAAPQAQTEAVELATAAPHLPRVAAQAELKARIARALPERVEAHLAPFLKGMQRRLERDLARLHDYFDGLRAESLLRLHKQGAAAETESARERLRLEAIAREYEAKVADLRQKYALRVDVAWSQRLDIVMPVVRFELLIKRRKGERKIALAWNPLARKLDIPPCEWSHTRNAVRLVCDDRLHLISPAAHAPCLNCVKAYCRACHPLQCPKCHWQRSTSCSSPLMERYDGNR